MKFAIIAAGEGSRLSQEGIDLPKPLVRIDGEPMIDRLVRIFNENGAEEVCIIVNRLHPQTEAHVRQLAKPGTGGAYPHCRQDYAQLHAQLLRAEPVPGRPALLPNDGRHHLPRGRVRPVRGGVPPEPGRRTHGRDGLCRREKPLYVGTDADLHITGFHDNDEGDRYISGGIYALRPIALTTLRRCMAEGKSRMRNFQRALIEDGRRLQAWPFSKVLDVDHASDIRKAEQFLNETKAV